jgi:hypothetical protein
MPTEPAVDVAAQMVAAIQAVHDNSTREHADARARWRRNVEAAAGQGGKLPQSAVDEVLSDSKLLGFSAEDFAADVHAVMEDGQLTAEIEAEQAGMLKASTDADSARLEVERLQADYLREREARDAVVNKIDAALRDKRRDLERQEADVMRRGLLVQRAHDKQTKFRTARARQRIFG